jgi:RNA polymerase sigma factor (sigma-70 family)
LSESFDPFYKERSSRFVVLLVAQGASQADAEDAMQEAMISTWQNWDSIESPRAYAWKAAYYAFLGLARKRDRKAVSLDDSGEDPEADSDLDLLAGKQRVLCLIRALPPGQRVIVALYFDGLTCEEIAVVVGKPVATVRSQLRHARKALKEMIEQGG